MREGHRSIQIMLGQDRDHPAYAGRTMTAYLEPLYHRDHPRLCGKDYASQVRIRLRDGITPAYAGRDHFVLFLTDLLGIFAYAGRTITKPSN